MTVRLFQRAASHVAPGSQPPVTTTLGIHRSGFCGTDSSLFGDIGCITGVRLAIWSLEIVAYPHPNSVDHSRFRFDFLEKLPGVTVLRLVNSRIDEQVRVTLARHIGGTVKRLDLSLFGYEDVRDAIALIASFPFLEELAVDWLTPSTYHAHDIHFPQASPHLRLRTLGIGYQLRSICPIVKWLVCDPAQSRIKSLQAEVRDKQDAHVLHSFLAESFGAVLEHLELHAMPFGNLDSTFGASEFSLVECTALRSFVLRISIEEMCTQDNLSLLWARALLAQLSSPHIETLVLSLRVDNMQNVQASECMTRELSTASFNDLRALDWEGIEQTLADSRFDSLKKFVLEGCGESTLLLSYIEERCPGLHARGCWLL
ncbi:hypothetical protein A0H81_11787 [Grifola frondosa]|uniref:F-box domain-containing protein n=1 Tax=Grifola frondosa TaxID=5627 RepID=A0A1C7LWA7_GRIFR|nr:hypothetical protein A0H81_11787 [Grifola frondosa]